MTTSRAEQRYEKALAQSARRLGLKVRRNFALLDMRDLDASWPTYLEAMNSAGVRAEYEVTTREALMYLLDVLMSAGHTIRAEPAPRPWDEDHIKALLRLTGPIHIKRLQKNGWTEQASFLSAFRRTVLWLTGNLYVEAQKSVIDAGGFLDQQAVLAGETKVLQGYERIPNPGACPFCLMLAGASRKHAVFNVSQAWIEPHPGCKCRIEPLPVYKTVRTKTAHEIALNRAMYESIKASRDRALAAAKAA